MSALSTCSPSDAAGWRKVKREFSLPRCAPQHAQIEGAQRPLHGAAGRGVGGAYQAEQMVSLSVGLGDEEAVRGRVALPPADDARAVRRNAEATAYLPG